MLALKVRLKEVNDCLNKPSCCRGEKHPPFYKQFSRFEDAFYRWEKRDDTRKQKEKN